MNAAELSATFDRALEVLGGEALMSSAERQRGLKFPAGGERIAELLLQVAEQHGVTPPAQSKIDAESIRARLRAAAELRPVAARATVVEAALSDRLRANERAAWEPTLALYRLLQTLAVSDAGIELSLAPIQELFSRRAKKTDSSPDAEEVTIAKTGLPPTTIQRSTQRATRRVQARQERAFVFCGVQRVLRHPRQGLTPRGLETVSVCAMTRSAALLGKVLVDLAQASVHVASAECQRRIELRKGEGAVVRRADPLQEVDVALVLSGKTPCALCGKPVTTGDDLVSFPAFLPSSHELGLFSDAPFHRACFEGDPRAERVNALHGRYRAIWDARPRELRTLAEIDAWGREAFKDFP